MLGGFTQGWLGAASLQPRSSAAASVSNRALVKAALSSALSQRLMW